MSEAITLFKDVFVPNAEGATNSFSKWKAANPGEYQKWETFKTAIFNAATPEDLPAPPVMASKKGKELVAAGELAMQFFIVIHLAQS